MKKSTPEAIVATIAASELRIDTLESRGLDRLDFHDVGVADLKRALLRAFEAGKAAR